MISPDLIVAAPDCRRKEFAMPRYASETSVSPEKSRGEIERTLTRYGAGAFGYLSKADSATIMFEFDGRAFRISVALPNRNSDEFWRTAGRGRSRTEEAAHKAWGQACRQKWRALALYIKATLEAVECGIMTIDDALLPYALLPGGQTVAEHVGPILREAIAAGKTPRLLEWSK